jgi:hypothetical protein
MPNKIKYICNAVKWFDKISGNTYHSVRITKCSNGETIVGRNGPYEYGYADQYRYTALDAMAHAKWLPVKFRGNHDSGYPKAGAYERESNYPIMWNVSTGLKKEMIQNGTI